jgi:[acyl-carrier-protein] S-malonyltransferase
VLGLEDHQIKTLCERATESAKSRRSTGASSELTVAATVEAANFNAPGQIVIAGSTDAVAEAVALIKAGGDFQGGKAIPLSVSAPFHCSLMKPARDRMAGLFSQAKPAVTPAFPYIPNRTGRMTSEAGVVFELLVEQVDHPVLWKQSMTAALEAGFERAIEFGPGKVLTGLMKRIGQPIGKTCAVLNVSDSAGVKALGGGAL